MCHVCKVSFILLLVCGLFLRFYDVLPYNYLLVSHQFSCFEVLFSHFYSSFHCEAPLKSTPGVHFYDNSLNKDFWIIDSILLGLGWEWNGHGNCLCIPISMLSKLRKLFIVEVLLRILVARAKTDFRWHDRGTSPLHSMISFFSVDCKHLLCIASFNNCHNSTRDRSLLWGVWYTFAVH